MELGLVKRKDIFGIESEELCSACKKVGKTCNQLALKCLDLGKYELAHVYLKRGEVVSSGDSDVRKNIFNSMASLYRQIGNYKLALHYLMLSLNLETNIDNKDKLRKARKHLNICAMSSQIGKHKIAHNHATVGPANF